MGAEPDKMAWPTKNDANDSDSHTTKARTPNTTALAASTTGRRGTAAKVARMLPDPYSALTVSPPSTPMASWPKSKPVRLTLVGSNSTRSTIPPWRHCDACEEVARIPMPRAATMVASTHHAVERTVRSLVHSDRTTARSGSGRRERPPCRRGGDHQARPSATGVAAPVLGAEFDALVGELHERLLE